MKCPTDTIIQCLDSIFLGIVFLCQSVILNYLVINQFIYSSFTFLWFLGDFLCLLIFAFTFYVAYRIRWKERHIGNVKGSNSLSNSRNSSRNGHRSIGSETTWPGAMNCFSTISKSPFSYVAWIVYSCCIIAKIIVLFKAKTPPRDLKVDEFFGPQMLKIAVSLSAIIFSLLVEAHHDGHDDPVRNANIKSMSYGMALEILDSVSFLSLLIVSETHLLYTFKFESFVLGLSSINLMLPAVSLYKLSVSGYGETYPLSLEILSKCLHLFFINIPYLSVRIYLWKYYSYSDTSIFLVKNIYSIVALIRGIYPDLKRAFFIMHNRKRHTSANRAAPISILPQDGTSSGNRKLESLEEVSIALTSFTPTIDLDDESDKLRQPGKSSISSSNQAPN